MTAIILLVSALVVLVVGYLVIQRSAAYPYRKVERLLAERAYDEAASIALDFDKIDEAALYFEQAGKLGRAAQLHARRGDHARAAALYEKAGDLGRAALQYEQAGDPARGAALRKKQAAAKEDAPASVAPAAAPAPVPPARPRGSVTPIPLELELELDDAAPRKAEAPRPPVQDPRAEAVTPAPPTRGTGTTPTPTPSPSGLAAAHPATPVPLDPKVRADRAEGDFRSAAARAGSSDPDQARIRDLAREAAEVLLAAGEIRRAADVFRDGGLDEEAVHLYVNVLGAAGDAAPLLAAAGHHERAAELYELGGMREAAAQEWATVARHAADPRRHLDRIGALSGSVLVHFLEEAVTGPGGAELRERLERARKDQAAAAPPAAPATIDPTETFEAELDSSDLESLARELAVSAAESAITSDLMGQIGGSRAEHAGPSRPYEEEPATLPPDGVGLEQTGAITDRLGDAPVRAARAGPSTDSLERSIGGQACELQNIEVYYRLGLACLAAGQWDAATARLEAVEEASPGYRDAWLRVKQLRAWRRAMGARITIGPATSSAGEGRYRIRGEIDRGPLAVVYRATDRLLRREVALKFFADDLGAIHEVRDVLNREGRALSQVSHPNLVTVYDNGTLEGRLYLAMEFVDGPSLERIVAAERLSIVEALRIMRQLLEALAYAHGRKMLHGALTPAHVLRSTAGLVKVVDFSVARALSASPRAARLLGASPYLSPEQRLGVEPDPRSDVFSAGAILYEVLTGRCPFPDERIKAAPERPRAVVPSIPEVLEATVMRALEIEPAERFPTASDFAKPIRRILEQVDARVGERASPQPPPPPVGAGTYAELHERPARRAKR